MRAAFEEANASAARIDGAEIVGEGVPADLGEGSGEFDSGGSGADDHEVQRIAGFTGRGAAFREFEGEQNSAADFERVLDGLEAGRESLPFVVAEVGVAGAGGDDEVVVRDLLNFVLRSVFSFSLHAVWTTRRSRSKPVTSAMSTSTFLWPLRIERIGAAISPGESPAVAT